MGNQTLHLLAEHDGTHVRLLSPSVGLFTLARASGAALTPGENAGVVLCLGREIQLLVPDGVRGHVVSAAPKALRAPVGYGTLLYELDTAQAAQSPASSGAGASGCARSAAGGHILRATQAGRFWLRPAPSEPTFVRVGQTLRAGETVGWIEVMKTFSQVAFQPRADQAGIVKLAKVLVTDGGDVAEGDPLFELELG